MNNEQLQLTESLSGALGVMPGLTAIVGGGGKTSTMLRLAEELAAFGRVIVTTSTHIWPPAGMPVLTDPSESEIEQALREARTVCVGSYAEHGKLTGCAVPMETLCTLAEYVLVEADGAKRLPLKAPAAHEPVIPACARQVIAVAGLDGVGKPACDTAFRTELYCDILHTDTAHVIAPEDVATVLCSLLGQRKSIPAGARFTVVLNKADDARRLDLAKEVSQHLDKTVVAQTAVTRLEGSTVQIYQAI